VQLAFEQKQQLCKLKKNNANLTHANLIEKAEELFKLKPSMSQITRMYLIRSHVVVDVCPEKCLDTSFYEVPISD